MWRRRGGGRVVERATTAGLAPLTPGRVLDILTVSSAGVAARSRYIVRIGETVTVEIGVVPVAQTIQKRSMRVVNAVH